MCDISKHNAEITRKEAEEVVRDIRQQDFENALDIFLKYVNGHPTEPDPSPLTPSGAIPPYLKPNSKKRHKKPGRKKGHKGKSRTTPDHIDKQVEHDLAACPHCQTPLEKSTTHRKRYIEDLPQVEPVVSEHIIHGYWCPCCRKQVEPAITEAMPNDNIGLHTLVMTAWLHYLGGISINYIVDMLNKLFHFKISPGGLLQGWIRIARLLTAEYENIAEKARDSAVLYADETGWRQSGDLRWLWCFTSKELCYYLIDKNRAATVVLKFLGECFQGILICDFWGAYNKIAALAKQRCFFHLFSELIKVDKRNDSVQWTGFRKTLSSILKRAVKLSDNKAEITPEQFQRRRKNILKQFDKMIYAAYEDQDCKRLCKRLKRHRKEIFTFLDYDGVSPYNNHAEQQMRKPVLWRRRCQQNRSDNGAAAQAVMMTIFRTAELRGLNPVDYVESLAKQQILENHTTKRKTNKAA